VRGEKGREVRGTGDGGAMVEVGWGMDLVRQGWRG
jgi:hypothetical protein